MPSNVHPLEWHPDRTPAIPLDVLNPVELVAAAYFCLNGLDDLDKLITRLATSSPANGILTKFRNRIKGNFGWQIE